MAKANSKCSTPHWFRITFLGIFVLSFNTAWLRGAAGESQRTFATPQAAIQATVEASEYNDTAALLGFWTRGQGHRRIR